MNQLHWWVTAAWLVENVNATSGDRLRQSLQWNTIVDDHAYDVSMSGSTYTHRHRSPLEPMLWLSILQASDVGYICLVPWRPYHKCVSQTTPAPDENLAPRTQTLPTAAAATDTGDRWVT